MCIIRQNIGHLGSGFIWTPPLYLTPALKVARIPRYTYIRKCKYKNVGKQIQTQILATKVRLYLNTRALFDTRRRSCSSDTAGVHIASTMKLPNKPQDLDHVFFTINTSLSFHVLSLIQLIFVVYSHVEDFRWLRSVCCHFASALPWQWGGKTCWCFCGELPCGDQQRQGRHFSDHAGCTTRRLIKADQRVLRKTESGNRDKEIWGKDFVKKWKVSSARKFWDPLTLRAYWFLWGSLGLFGKKIWDSMRLERDFFGKQAVFLSRKCEILWEEIWEESCS